jgi:hypothetical protein
MRDGEMEIMVACLANRYVFVEIRLRLVWLLIDPQFELHAVERELLLTVY